LTVFLRHTFSPLRYKALPKSNLFSFHREDAAARRSRINPKNRLKNTTETGGKSGHKTQIYNI